MRKSRTSKITNVQEEQLTKILNHTSELYLRNCGLNQSEMRNVLARWEILETTLIKTMAEFAEDCRNCPDINYVCPSTFIQIGTYSKMKDLCRAIYEKDMDITPYAEMMTKEIILSSNLEKVDIYEATNAELGFPCGCSTKETFEAIDSIGGIKLVPEVGLYLRIRYSDQDKNELALVYMDPIYVCQGHEPRIFGLFTNSEGKLTIGGRYVPEFYDGKKKWIYSRKK